MFCLHSHEQTISYWLEFFYLNFRIRLKTRVQSVRPNFVVTWLSTPGRRRSRARFTTNADKRNFPAHEATHNRDALQM